MNRASAQRLAQTKLVPGVRAESILGHQLSCDFSCQLRPESAANVDIRQLLQFESRISGQLHAFPIELRALGIRLRTHRDVLARGHG